MQKKFSELVSEIYLELQRKHFYADFAVKSQVTKE